GRAVHLHPHRAADRRHHRHRDRDRREFRTGLHPATGLAPSLPAHPVVDVLLGPATRAGLPPRPAHRAAHGRGVCGHLLECGLGALRRARHHQLTCCTDLGGRPHRPISVIGPVRPVTNIPSVCILLPPCRATPLAPALAHPAGPTTPVQTRASTTDQRYRAGRPLTTPGVSP